MWLHENTRSPGDGHIGGCARSAVTAITRKLVMPANALLEAGRLRQTINP